MAYRCPSCNKFCGIEPNEPELDGTVDYQDGKGLISVHATITFQSVCCGDEVATAEFDPIEYEFTSADVMEV